MNHDEQPTITPELSEADKQAIDQLFEHGLATPASPDPRQQRVSDLLSLLGTPVQDEAHRASRIDLIDVMTRRQSDPRDAEIFLTPKGQDAVDAFVDAGYQADAVDAQHSEHAKRLEQIGAMLTDGAKPEHIGREDLVISTLGTIQNHIDSEQAAMQFESQRGFQLPARWADVVSIAAMLLLAFSVVMPILSGMRSSSQQQLCFDNMNQTANAFGLYTGANRDMLPMATAGFGPTWLDVGTTPERSNSSNLYTLIRNGFAGLDDLACPTNLNAKTGEPDPDAWDWESLEQISYSYRIMPRGGMRATSINEPMRVVLLADRSPVILRVVRQQPVIPEQNTPNHSSSGQHMLMLDGSSQWSSSPVLEGRDNIWLPRPIETLIHNERVKRGIEIEGNEQPAGPTDAFVGP